MMKVKMLGTGNAFSRRRNNTCFLVEAGQAYLVDCPKNVLKVFYAAQVEPSEVNDVIITHLHPDHYGDFETLAMYKRYVEKRKFNVITTREIYEGLKEKAKHSLLDSGQPAEMVDGFFDFIEVEPDAPYERGGTKISVRKNVHAVPTVGVKIERDGRSLGYSGDTVYDAELIEGFLQHADLILHEVGDRKNIGVHTDLEELEGLPEDVRAKLVLVHLPDNGVKTALRQAKDYEVFEV